MGAVRPDLSSEIRLWVLPRRCPFKIPYIYFWRFSRKWKYTQKKTTRPAAPLGTGCYHSKFIRTYDGRTGRDRSQRMFPTQFNSLHFTSFHFLTSVGSHPAQHREQKRQHRATQSTSEGSRGQHREGAQRSEQSKGGTAERERTGPTSISLNGTDSLNFTRNSASSRSNFTCQDYFNFILKDLVRISAGTL